jgi:hypothetical protein
MKCRSCGSRIDLTLIDLGTAPLSNAYLTEVTMRRPEKWFPLHVGVCESCWLVQAGAYSRASEIFGDDYAYFSSFSDAWMKHSREYCEMISRRFNIDSNSFVIEVASNDGYLLSNFVEFGVPCLGIEPTASTAAVARARSVHTIERFFGMGLAEELHQQFPPASLLVANNVLAHVPDQLDFLKGVRVVLGSSGIATFEFPHLQKLIQHTQFDTIYHEHFCYFSFTAVESLMSRAGLTVFDVELLNTHGGSLRVYSQRDDSSQNEVSDRVAALLAEEMSEEMLTSNYYSNFAKAAEKVKNDFLQFLLDAKRNGRLVLGYGAAAKGNTLLNYAGVRPDLIPLVVDRNPAKQGKFLPGSRIPIYGEEKLRELQPDYVVIFPWNLKEEITDQLSYVRDWNCKLVTAVPNIEEF